MMTITCHCGDVALSFEHLPSVVRDCDCPICNRLGALWADFDPDDVVIRARQPTVSYRWGDGDYQMHHCARCGCTTHYAAIEQRTSSEWGINLRLLERAQLEQIPIVRSPAAADGGPQCTSGDPEQP